MSNFFRPIGTHAQDADDRPEVFEGAVVAENEEEHPVQQIESLCMECGENVCCCFALCSVVSLRPGYMHTGNDKPAFDEYSVFQGR